MESFSAGLKDAGHSNEVIDLHAIGFDPVFREHDGPNWVDDSVPDDVLDHWDVEKSLLAGARTPLQRWLVKRWIGGLDARGIIRKIRARGGPNDIAAQQEKVARADASRRGYLERAYALGRNLEGSESLRATASNA